MPVRPMREGLFGATLEDAFQKLLERYPEIIPGKQIRPGAEDPPRLSYLGGRRQFPVGRSTICSSISLVFLRWLSASFWRTPNLVAR